jgi:hypothetical protein
MLLSGWKTTLNMFSAFQSWERSCKYIRMKWARQNKNRWTNSWLFSRNKHHSLEVHQHISPHRMYRQTWGHRHRIHSVPVQRALEIWDSLQSYANQVDWFSCTLLCHKWLQRQENTF